MFGFFFFFLDMLSEHYVEKDEKGLTSSIFERVWRIVCIASISRKPVILLKIQTQ